MVDVSAGPVGRHPQVSHGPAECLAEGDSTEVVDRVLPDSIDDRGNELIGQAVTL